MLFSVNLHEVLQDIYVLVNKAHFSAEYVEKLPPNERALQIFYYKKDLEEQVKARRKSTGHGGPTIGEMPNGLGDG
jgi:hypothetical protein